ncbi:hypothetical protein YK48G_02040 [Lentilactobacillus fungorum]|uniref:DUF2721 domain-containing protein n=1 Tax=Lentilactobacillus fungorum TaxID=2201250 RepID=A0ABQ3VWR0_9LACO|nr:hypothetical protein [Lentilactobacillus fungorum]GHP12779.1 hypothetical protein YK48G_02040 [Lentilactobacillus fungorum]
MNDILKVADFILIYFLINLWIGDFFAIRKVGKSSATISKLLKKDARALKLALENTPNLTAEAQVLAAKKIRIINRWYFLANKTGTMIFILALQQGLVIFAKQNWGLITIEIMMLVICGFILAADFRVNIVRSQLEKALKPYEDRLWFEYRLRS